MGNKIVHPCGLETDPQVKDIILWCGRFKIPSLRDIYPREFLYGVVPGLDNVLRVGLARAVHECRRRAASHNIMVAEISRGPGRQIGRAHV